jgi:hypothetical protein
MCESVLSGGPGALVFCFPWTWSMFSGQFRPRPCSRRSKSEDGEAARGETAMVCLLGSSISLDGCATLCCSQCLVQNNDRLAKFTARSGSNCWLLWNRVRPVPRLPHNLTLDLAARKKNPRRRQAARSARLAFVPAIDLSSTIPRYKTSLDSNSTVG